MLEQKFQRFSITNIFFSWWQAFAAYMSGSSGLKENILTFDFFRKLLFFIIFLFSLDLRYWHYLPHIDDIYLFILCYCIWFLFYYGPHEAQMFLCRGQLLLVNFLRYRCYIAKVFYFVFSSEMENRTLSQMCGRLYLPMFLLRVGVLPDVYSFFYGSGHILTLCAYYFEIIHCCCIASNILMFKNWWWSF